MRVFVTGATGFIGSAIVKELIDERGFAKGRYHAVGDEGVPFQKIAESIGAHLRLPILSKSPAETTNHFDFLGSSLGIDNPTFSAFTQERLEWRPTARAMLPDLDGTWYFSEQAAGERHG